MTALPEGQQLQGMGRTQVKNLVVGEQLLALPSPSCTKEAVPKAAQLCQPGVSQKSQEKEAEEQGDREQLTKISQAN